MYPSVLTMLADDASVEVRRLVAINYNTTPELMRRLAEDEDAGVRQALRGHPDITPEIEALLDGD